MGQDLPDPAMTLAAVDRLVHHATIFEMNVESYRRRAALERKRGPGRPPAHATIKANAATVAPRQSNQTRPLPATINTRRSCRRRDAGFSS